jgi:hypothetical protein
MVEIILFGAVILTAVILLILRTNAGLVFIALAAGNTLLEFASNNLSYINTKLQSNTATSRFNVSQTSLEIVILLLPAVIIILLTKHDQGKRKWPIQIFPALATGLLGSLLIIPLLSASAQNSVANSSFWNLAQKYQTPIVAVGLLVSLIVVVVSSHSSHFKHHSKSRE